SSVMVADVETLWNLGREYLPLMMERFERLGEAIGSSQESRVLRRLYEEMPILDFSHTLLRHISERIGVMEVEEVLWSDWERPDRILNTLNVLGREPEFPPEIGISTPSDSSSPSAIGVA